MKVVWLLGDYTGKNKERQRQARQRKCDLVIDFHFNAADDARANGAEVWYRMYSIHSKRLAEILLCKICALGLKRRGVKVAHSQTRASFINAYPNDVIAVLLEPAFVTNRSDARKLHDGIFIKKLALAITNAIKQFAKEIEPYRKISVIGLSVGHLSKTSNPNDRGAKCAFGDFEADHAKELAVTVARYLSDSIEIDYPKQTT